MSRILKVIRLTPTAVLPKYMTDGAAGFDICSDEDAFLISGGNTMLHTGIAVEFPKGYVLSIRQRSGISKTFPNYLAIGVGTIDWDYRGEIMVPIVNNNDFDMMKIYRGDRIVQGILQPVSRMRIKEVESLSETERGKGGFGHTGVE